MLLDQVGVPLSLPVDLAADKLGAPKLLIPSFSIVLPVHCLDIPGPLASSTKPPLMSLHL